MHQFLFYYFFFSVQIYFFHLRNSFLFYGVLNVKCLFRDTSYPQVRAPLSAMLTDMSFLYLVSILFVFHSLWLH